jgi:hypothetical protein
MSVGAMSTIVRWACKSADTFTVDCERLQEVTDALAADVCDITFPDLIAL